MEECRSEAVERLTRAAAARDTEDGAAAEQESGYAARWATAAVVRWETLSDDVTRLAGAAQSAGTAWAAEAATVGVSLLRRAGKVVAEIHERAKLPLPPEVATHLLGSRAEHASAAAPRAKTGDRADRGGPRTGGQYELIGGELWQRGERPKRLLNLDVQIDPLEYAVDGGDDKLDLVPLQGRDSRAAVTAVRSHRTATNVIFRWTSPLTGEVERERVDLDFASRVAGRNSRTVHPTPLSCSCNRSPRAHPVSSRSSTTCTVPPASASAHWSGKARPPLGFVVAATPRSAALSASFSPSTTHTVCSADNAACTSGHRYSTGDQLGGCRSTRAPSRGSG